MIFLVDTSIPITRYSNMLTFTDTNQSFKTDGDLLKIMTNYNFNFDHSNPQDQKVICEFGKKMKFDIEQKGRKSPQKRPLD